MYSANLTITQSAFNAGLNHAEFTALIVAKQCILRPKQLTPDTIISYRHVKKLEKP